MGDVGISVFCGVPGAGKTLAAVEDIAHNPGRVIGNIRLSPLHPAYHRYEYLPSELLLQEIKDERSGKVIKTKGFWEYPALQGRTKERPYDPGYTIYIDEADIYFPCNGFTALQDGYLHTFLKQHRKRNIRMVFVVQSVPNLWVRIRRLAQEFILCHKDSSGRSGQWLPDWCGPINNFIGRFFNRYVRVRYASEKMMGMVDFAFVRESQMREVFTWYDTRELI